MEKKGYISVVARNGKWYGEFSGMEMEFKVKDFGLQDTEEEIRKKEYESLELRILKLENK